MKKPFKKQLKKFLKSKKLGFILAAVQLVITAMLLGILIYLNMIPAKYFFPVTAVLLLLIIYVIFTQQSKKFRTFGKILSVIFSILFSIATGMLFRANGVLDSITGADKKTDIISIYVMATDSAESLSDAAAYNFGILSSLDRENTDKTITDINGNLNTSIAITEFSDTQSLAEALYSGNVQAIILNEAFVSTIEDIQNSDGSYPYMYFTTDTKKLSSKKIVTQIDRTTSTNVVKEPFMIYLSGIDVAGSISTTSRSDVNIIAVVNPVTYQILLLSTPRDYYVPTTVSGGVRDKLTHAGRYGVDCSMGTLDMLYDININYYFRVNFTGFTEVIDAVGGITVHSNYDFVTTHGGDHITVGDNYLNGKEALGFARERYAFADGDRQRGRNQMAVITAVINKMASSAILNNYSGLMSGLEGSFETSLSAGDISSLVKFQLDKMPSWNVVSYSVNGPGDSQTTYSAPRFKAWVMQPNETYIQNAKVLINQVMSGEVINTDVLQDAPNY